MATREEIREGLKGMELGTESEGVFNYNLSSADVKKILSYLDSQGVVVQSKEVVFHHGYFPEVESLLEEKCSNKKR